MAQVHTSGDIARLLDTGVVRVRHVLNTRDDIKPIGRAGIVRLYGDDAIRRVEAELAIIECRRRKAKNA